jgi:soluble lytic murein transglycosylase
VSSRRTRAIALALACLAAGCPTRDGATTPAQKDAAIAAQEQPDAAAEAAPADVGGAGLAFPDLIRREQWDAAEEAIAKLPAAERQKPEVRYARARVALARARAAEALEHLEKVEDEMPLLRDLVAKARAQAALSEGPYDKAAEWYAARSDVGSWLTAARAWERAGDEARARAQCDRVIAEGRRTRAQEEAARTMRMKILRAKENDAAAAGDARWLAIHALDAAVAKAGRELLEMLAPPRPLDASDWLQRAKVAADAARTEMALEAVDRAAAAKPPPTPLDVCRARAEVLYKARTRYVEAAAAYQRCAQMGGPHVAEDAFLHARALSRADKDAEALAAFEKVVAKHPKTPWADEATFHIARSHALAGKWSEAMRDFDEYAKQFPNGREKREADRYRAIAHLNAQDHKGARRLLEELAGRAEDAVQQGRWIDLAALAALRDGDKTFAIGRWADVARTRPLTWAALVARARLAEVGAPVPDVIDHEEATPAPAPAPIATDLPPPADVLQRVGLDADAEEALRDREGIITGRAAGRGTEALCGAYGKLDRGKRRYALSLGVPAALLATAPSPKTRWAWECSFPRPHDGFVRPNATKTRLSPELLWAVMRQESAFDAEVVSPARAVGLLQLLPETAIAVAKKAGLPEDPTLLVRPSYNVSLGALYLRELLDQLDGNVPLAVAAYNAGPEAILRWRARAKGETLDVFVETIPFVETRAYVVRVMSNLARYGFLEAGKAGVPRIALDLERK